MRKFTEVPKHNRDAHARVPFSARIEKMIAITLFFSPFVRAETVSMQFATFTLRGLLSEPGLKFQPWLKFTM